MRTSLALAFLLVASAGPSFAQPADPHAGHTMPAPTQPPAPDPHAGHTMPAPPPAADPHAGHRMPAPATDPHTGHTMPASPTSGSAPPAVPTDHAAERFYTPDTMARARELLRREHGEMTWTTVKLDRAEYRPADRDDGFAWEGRVSSGGDIHRVVAKTEGDGTSGDIEEAEVQVLYNRAVGPYFNLQGGLRQDFEPQPRRSYIVLGLEGLAPYWFDVDGALFLSNKGDLSARFEASYDIRLTGRLALEPALEINLQAQDVAALGVGSGVSDVEAGLRLLYAITPEFAPYVGVNHTGKFGGTADSARRVGEHVHDTRMVIGVRAWF